MRFFYNVLVVASALGIGVSAFSHGSRAADADKSEANRDQLLAAVQEICPVTGVRLGDHGTPVKVTVGKEKETVFLCCTG